MPEQFGEKERVSIDSEMLKEIRGAFAEELEKRAAQSANWKQFLGEDVGERVVCEEKVRRTMGTENLVTDIGHKFKLSEETIVELKRLFLEEDRRQ